MARTSLLSTAFIALMKAHFQRTRAWPSAQCCKYVMLRNVRKPATSIRAPNRHSMLRRCKIQKSSLFSIASNLIHDVKIHQLVLKVLQNCMDSAVACYAIIRHPRSTHPTSCTLKKLCSTPQWALTSSCVLSNSTPGEHWPSLIVRRHFLSQGRVSLVPSEKNLSQSWRLTLDAWRLTLDAWRSHFRQKMNRTKPILIQSLRQMVQQKASPFQCALVKILSKAQQISVHCLPGNAMQQFAISLSLKMVLLKTESHVPSKNAKFDTFPAVSPFRRYLHNSHCLWRAICLLFTHPCWVPTYC